MFFKGGHGVNFVSIKFNSHLSWLGLNEQQNLTLFRGAARYGAWLRLYCYQNDIDKA